MCNCSNFYRGAWLANHIYINPLTEERVNKLIAGPYMFISFVSGSTIGFLMFIALMNIISRLFRGRELHIKTIAILLFTFGAGGVGVNTSIYISVINPNSMLEYPKKSGYKENLKRDYVSDISLCEKF